MSPALSAGHRSLPANMKRSLEQAWLEISTDLDEVLDLDAQARQAWLETLEIRDPDRARRVRSYLLDLERLESANFLGTALPSVLSVNTTLVGRRLGSYTVDRAIGQGGMGTRIELFLNVLAAVSHAHSRLVIHRDSKPANDTLGALEEEILCAQPPKEQAERYTTADAFAEDLERHLRSGETNARTRDAHCPGRVFFECGRTAGTIHQRGWRLEGIQRHSIARQE